MEGKIDRRILYRKLNKFDILTPPTAQARCGG